MRLNEAKIKKGKKGREDKKRKGDKSYDETRDEELKVKWHEVKGTRKDEEEGEEEGGIEEDEDDNEERGQG